MTGTCINRYSLLQRLIAGLMCGWMLFAASVAMAAQAQPKQPGPINKPQVGSSGSTEDCRSQYDGKLIAVIVPCLRDTIQEATEYITDQFDEMLKAGATAFAVLVVTIFGVKGMTQEGDVKKDGFILLMKIGLMFLFIDNFGGYIPAAFNTVQEGVEIVTSTLGSGNYECDMSGFPGEMPWAYMDCVLGTLFGFAPNMILGSSVFGVLGSALWSGQFGAMLFAGGMFIFFFLLRLLLRAIYTYLMALVILGFLIIISPVLIPLLMMGVTFQYFEHWMRATISVMLQPVIMLAYITLSFSILDQMMFDDEKGIAKQMPPDEVEKMWQQKAPHSSKVVSNEGELVYEKVYGNYDPNASHTLNPTSPNMGDAADINSIFNELYTMNLGDNRAEKGQDIFITMAALALVVYLLDSMLDNILRIAQIVLGGGFMLGQAVSDNPLERGLDQIQEKSHSSFQQATTSIGNAVKGLVSGRRSI